MSNLFDSKFYRNAYPDLIKFYSENDHKQLANHFIVYGHKESRLCSIDMFKQVYKNIDIIKVPAIVESKYGLTFPNLEQVLGWVWVNKIQLEIVPVVKRKTTSLDKKIIDCIKDKNIVINSHSNLSVTGGDTIMLSNWLNELLPHTRHITIISKYDVPKNFTRNVEYTNYTIKTVSNDIQIVNYLQQKQADYGCLILRNHEILKYITENNNNNHMFIQKTIIYGLDIHIPYVSKLKNSFLYVVTQSDILKQKFIRQGVNESKIIIQNPVAKYWDFKNIKRAHDKTRMIYCGTLREEENILEIIDEFQKIHQKRPEMVLKIVYGKIHGTETFIKKVNEYIKNGVKGITFKHNLSHRDACYEIATSDIGICWRKKGWGNNGEVSTKVKEYEMYGLQIKRDSLLNHDITLICCTKRPTFHYNILQTVKNLQDTNINIQLLLCLNNKLLSIERYKQFFDDNNINNNIIKSNKTLGECLNMLVSRSSSDYIFKIDDDDIYLPGLINNIIPHLYSNSVVSTSKKHVYCPEHDKFYIRENNIGYGSLLSFNKFKVKKFNHSNHGEDTDFLNKNKVKLLDLSKFHIHVRHTKTQFHSDKDNNYFTYLKPVTVNEAFKTNIKQYGLYDLDYFVEHNIKSIKNSLKNISKYKPKYNVKKLSILGIFDEFLFNTLKTVFDIKLISPNESISGEYSFFFCESCWNGNNGEWKYKINSNCLKREVLDILKQCKKLNIPTIFYNKEDPVNFEGFIKTAKHFDIIITTDINCVSKYKQLTQSKIFVMPFTINPLNINNIGRQNDNNGSFFAGSYTYFLSKERSKNTNILLDTLKEKELIVFDRNLDETRRREFYNNMYNMNMFHPKYNQYIHPAISHIELMDVHSTRNWCGNLNTVKNSDTMFARRVLEASIMKNSLVTDYSQGVYKNFENSIYKLEDKLKYDNNEDIVSNQTKKQQGWRNVIENYNSYKHFSDLFKDINIKGFENPFEHTRKISVICSTNRVDNLSIILDNFNRQTYTNKELIIIFNLDMNSKIKNIIENNNNSNIKIKQIDEKETLGYCLNEAVKLSNGEIISKFDDDDFYGGYYLQDMYYSMVISNADLVGKCAHMVYARETKELWVKFYNINYENYTYLANKWNYICGASLFFKKSLHKKCKFKESNTGEDTDFIEQVKNNNFIIYASDFLNYCTIRDKKEKHSWQCDLDKYFGKNSIMISKYNKFPTNLIDC